MSNGERVATCISLALLGFIALVSAAKSETIDRRLIGAWHESSSDCAKLFEKRSGRVQFRRPIDQFVSALLIGPSTIDSTGARCRIDRAKRSGEVTLMTLTCNNSIGYSPHEIRLEIVSDVELIYGSQDKSPLDRRYQKCAP